MFKRSEPALGFVSVVFFATLAFSSVLAQTLTVDVTDPELDLHTQIEACRAEVTPLVEPGPKLVVGQGEDANNYTLIKCLDEYGVPYVQFLAYPTAVRGGVSVNAGELLPDSGLEIVANPLTSTVSQNIRVFTNTGLLKSEFQPSSMTAPYVVAVADFLSSHSGDEIAVTQRNPVGSDRIRFYDAYGTLLADWAAPMSSPAPGETVTMAPLRMTGDDEVLIGYPVTGWVYRMHAATGTVQAYDNSAIGPFNYLGESVVYDEVYSVGKAFPNTESSLWARTATAVTGVNAGTKEKNFHIRPNSSDTAWTDAAYVKNSLFRHLRTDQHTPAYYNPDFENNDYEYWAGGTFTSWIASTQANYFTAKPSVWEPCFTHRHGASASTAWYNPIDPATGYRKYMMLSRLNNPVTYVETGTFNCLTYALDISPINNMYIWPLRAYLLELAKKFRGSGGAPEQLVALEPNHEMEIPGTRDNSIGDYNTNMISGFYGDLIRRYNDLGKINTKFGTSFTQASFDAPRDLGRGDWDAYSDGNEFCKAWVEYNRKVVLTRIAQGEREALMAGFPPAAIKTHQIPADYAVGSVISGHRVTPIDWTLAGPCGYGGTRYGIWYPGDFVGGAVSSGFNMINIGEYNPLTTNQSAANAQMDYLFYNGVNFVSFEPGTTEMNLVAETAYKRLFTYGPRPGTTDGIGQIRAVSQPTAGDGVKRYNVICLGKTGLLKSLNADGSWEGTVYAEPFRQRVNISAISESISFNLTTSDYAIGPIEGLMAGDQVEINFRARSANASPAFTLWVEHDGVEMPNHRFVVGITDTEEYYRYTLRIQEPMDSVRILINSGEKDGPTGYQQTVVVSDFSVWVEKPAVTRVEYGIGNAKANVGGVTFDILSASHIPNSTVDTTPKSMTINFDDPYATSTSATLNMSHTDAVNMRFSNDGVTWSTWEDYSTTKSWALTPGDGTKCAYVQFRYAGGTTSAVFSDSIILDTTAPTGSLAISSGATFTNSTSVTLKPTAMDAGSCVYQMRFLNAGDSTWSDWEPYAASTSWTLRSGDGAKSVAVQFRDIPGNISPVYTDSIVLDTIGPSGSIAINSGDEFTISTDVTLALSADDQGSGVSQMRFSNEGSTWSSWATFAETRSWALPSGDGAKSVVVEFKDAAGNVSSFADSILLDTTGPTGSITINSGDQYTTSTAVTLTLSAEDSVSGVSQMTVRNIGFPFGDWEPYVTTRQWLLTSGDGTKYVYVLFKDAAGKISSSYSDSIVLSTTPPTVNSILPSSGPNTGTTNITNLVGTGFLSGATVKLQKSGQSDITASSVNVVSSTGITCSFDLNGRAIGLWDVVVTNPDMQSATLMNGFGITIANSRGVVGTSISSLLDAVAVPASVNYEFCVWGVVETIDSSLFWLDDGSGTRIKVFAPGYTDLATGDFASATGTVDVSATVPVLVSSRSRVR